MTPSRSGDGSMDERVVRLERLRQEVELWSWQEGNLGDYLDKGNPSDQDAKRARAAMKESERATGDAKRRLITLTAEMRMQSPAVVADWTGRHMAILRRILAKPDQGSADPGSDQSVRLHVARETLRKWQRVAAGEGEVVLINRGYLGDYGDEVDSWVEQS